VDEEAIPGTVVFRVVSSGDDEQPAALDRSGEVAQRSVGDETHVQRFAEILPPAEPQFRMTDALLAAREQAVQAGESVLAGRERELSGIAQRLEEARELLESREQRVAGLEAQAAELRTRTLELDAREEALVAGAIALDQRNATLDAREASLAAGVAALADREAGAEARDRMLATAIAVLGERKDEIDRRAAKQEETQESLELRGDELEVRVSAVEARAATVEEETALIDARSVQLAEAEQALAEREERLVGFEAARTAVHSAGINPEPQPIDYVLLVPTGDGYVLAARRGIPPPKGVRVRLPGFDAGRFDVTRIGQSPLPEDPRPCLYLTRA
jgi:hypothetical protein